MAFVNFSAISSQFYGHQHSDALKSLGTTWAAMSPSVTPWRSTLAPETGANNPGLRLVTYDKDTGEVRIKDNKEE